MSSPINAITPALFQQQSPETYIAANGTAAKILVDVLPGAAASGTTPALYGGGTVIDLTAVSTDSSSKDVILYSGVVASTQGGATGAVTTTTSTIVRTTGSFISDGWQAGDLVMTFAPSGTAANASMDGILGTVTTVSATTLTVNGTPFAALTLATGTRIVRVAPHCRMTVAANSGSNGTTVSASLLGNALDGSAIRTEIKLGSNNMLVAAMQAAVSALPAYVSIRPVVALY